jgi:hypothetical protein
MRNFVKQANSKELKGRTSAMESARSHLIAFAAEHSRVTGRTWKLDDYIAELKSTAR